MQNVVKLAHFISALHYPWCHFISSLQWVSLAEYLLVLRVYSHLLQVVMYHGYSKNWMAPAVVAECDHGHDPLSYLVYDAFVGVDLDTGMYLK
jgi:hypothetical protein